MQSDWLEMKVRLRANDNSVGLPTYNDQTLSTWQWIRDCHGLLLQCPPSVRKSHLCVALGTRTIENGFNASFYRVDEILYQLKAANGFMYLIAAATTLKQCVVSR